MASLLDMPTMHYTTSGRASIFLALAALGVGNGHRVLLPTYHCPTMVAPAVARGAALIFYPIDERGTPDLAWLRTQELHGVRAILVAHFFGLPQPMAAIRHWCNERGIALIEDCAHALFGTSGARAIGSWGDMAIGSLTKFLPVPEGGCLVNNSGGPPPPLLRCSAKSQLKAAVDILEEGARYARLPGLNSAVTRPLATLRWLRRRSKPNSTAPLCVNNESNVDPLIDIDPALANRALSEPSRWLARSLPRQRIVEGRRQRYAELVSRLAGRQGLRPLFPVLPPACAPYVMPLWVDNPDPGYAELRRLNMPILRWDRLWEGTPRFRADCGLSWSHHVLQLPCHQDLCKSDVNNLLTAVLDTYSRSQPA